MPRGWRWKAPRSGPQSPGSHTLPVPGWTRTQLSLGARRWWAQDESLGLFLVLDRLLPNWPELTFGAQGMGAVELLETALRH